jgi:hypothetical protein
MEIITAPANVLPRNAIDLRPTGQSTMTPRKRDLVSPAPGCRARSFDEASSLLHGRTGRIHDRNDQRGRHANEEQRACDEFTEVHLTLLEHRITRGAGPQFQTVTLL